MLKIVGIDTSLNPNTGKYIITLMDIHTNEDRPQPIHPLRQAVGMTNQEIDVNRAPKEIIEALRFWLLNENNTKT